MAHSSARRFLSPAQLDAAIAFGGKRSALSEALQEAKEQYGSAIQGSRTSSKLTQQAANYAKPQIEALYGGAQAGQEAAQKRAEATLGALPHDPVLDAYRATQAGGAQTQLANLLAAGASRQAHLSGIGTAAQAGAQFDESAARQTLLKSVQGILAKRTQVKGEEGLYASSEAQKLAREAEQAEQKERENNADNLTSRRNNEESSRTSRENAKEKGHGGSSVYVGGVKQQSSSAQTKARERLANARSLAAATFKERKNRGQVLGILTEEEPSISHSHSVYKNGKPTGNSESINIPARKAFPDDVVTHAAIDEAQFGGVTPGTVKALHEAGYSIKQLGLKIAPKRSVQVQRGAASVGRGVSKALRGL